MENNKGIIRSGDEAVKMGKSGGIKSGESRRKKKAVRDILNNFLYSKANDKDKELLQALYPDLEDEDITVLDKILAGAIYNIQACPKIKDVQELLKLAGLYTEKQEISFSDFNLFKAKVLSRAENIDNA